MDDKSKKMDESKYNVILEDKYLNIIYKAENYDYTLNQKNKIFFYVIILLLLLLLKKFDCSTNYLSIKNKNNEFNKSSHNNNDLNKNEKCIFTNIFYMNNETTSNISFINKYYGNQTADILNENHMNNEYNQENSFINNRLFINYSYNLIFKNNIFNKIINYYSIIKLEKKNNNSDNNGLFWTNEILNINKIQEEILKYKNNISNLSFENKKEYYKRDYPKITLIITIYNQKEYIYKIYSCIQNQSFKDIEIIFIDDNSMDNSFKVIYQLIKEDKRIIYIKNTINKGQFYSRYVGIKMAKGDYILIIDPDDLLINNILNKSYEFAKYYDLDIVHYYHLKGNFTNNILRKMRFSGFFYNEQIKNIYFNCSYRYLWDKLIKRKVYIESIEFIKEKYRNSRIIIHNDEVACYCVFRVAKSYGVLEQIGYFYNRENPNSITKFNFQPENINGRFNSLFTIMEFYYEQSDNNAYEKTMGGYNFFKSRIKNIYYRRIQYLTNGFNYINNILDLYLNSSFFNYKQKYNLIKFKNMINKQKLKILNSLNI